MGYTDSPDTENTTDLPEPKDKADGGKHSTVGVVVTTIIVVFVVLGIIGAISSSTSSSSNQATSTPPNQNQSVSSPEQSTPATSNNNQSQGNTSQITASDIALYLRGVYGVLCYRKDNSGVEQLYDTGSGSLWTFSDGSDDIVTNEHVIAGDDYCVIYNSNVGMFGLNLSAVKAWNQLADEAIIPVSELPSSKPVPVLPSRVLTHDKP